jgi:hypothetical protein
VSEKQARVIELKEEKATAFDAVAFSSFGLLSPSAAARYSGYALCILTLYKNYGHLGPSSSSEHTSARQNRKMKSR